MCGLGEVGCYHFLELIDTVWGVFHLLVCCPRDMALFGLFVIHIAFWIVLEVTIGFLGIELVVGYLLDGFFGP